MHRVFWFEKELRKIAFPMSSYRWDTLYMCKHLAHALQVQKALLIFISTQTTYIAKTTGSCWFPRHILEITKTMTFKTLITDRRTIHLVLSKYFSNFLFNIGCPNSPSY